MALRRVYVDRIDATDAWASGDRARHLHKVVRIRPGEEVEVSDFTRAFRASVESSSNSEVRFRLIEALPEPRTAVRITLYLAVIKFPRFEWAIEKATELGVNEIVPVAAERSDRGLVQAAAKRRDRWSAIAEEAAQQSRRLAPPTVSEPVSLTQSFSTPADLRLILDFNVPPMKDVLPPGLQSASLWVGPEGGWTDAERQEAEAAGCRPVSLGDAVLRAETAALAGVAVLSHWLSA